MGVHPESPHAAADFDNEQSEIASTLDRATAEEAEVHTSGHLVRMIDFFFALVLGQGILRYHQVVTAPFQSNGVVILALVTIYYTVIRSFVAWHTAIEQRRYRINTTDVRTIELWRLYIDALIVAVYAYMVLCAEPLINDGGASIEALLWGFPLLFLLYLAWGLLRRAAWGPDEFEFDFLILFGGLYAFVAEIYSLAPYGLLERDRSTVNGIFLSICLLLMFLYRYINFWQGYPDKPRWLGLPKPRIPSLGTLVQTEPDGQ